MTTDVLRKNRTPPPPVRLGAWIACILEMAIVFTFFVNKSVFGVILCAAYGWYSATWSILRRPPEE